MPILLLLWRVLDHAIIRINSPFYNICLSKMRNYGTSVLNTLLVDPDRAAPMFAIIWIVSSLFHLNM